MEMTEQDKKKIAADAAAESRKLMADLSKEFPGDPKFAQEQFAKGSTVIEAKAAYADKLKVELAESKTVQEELQAELTKAKAQTPPAKKPAGCKPVAFGDGGENAETGPRDFVAAAKDRAVERKITVTQAMQELARMDPEAHQAWLDKTAGPVPVV